MANKPSTWKVRVDDATDEIVIELDQPTAKGRFVLRLDIYGIELICPDVDAEPIAFLDFWNRARGRHAALERAGVGTASAQPQAD